MDLGKNTVQLMQLQNWLHTQQLALTKKSR